MLPGFLLMLGLSILYVEAGLDERFEELFYGLKAAVGALVGMAIVRLGRKFTSDVPLAVIAAASLGLTLGFDLSFVLVLLAAGVAYELWTTAGTRAGAASSFSIAPVAGAALVLGAVTLPLKAEIFLEGLKAGLLTFGGAYTVVPFLQDTAVDSQGWLTNAEFLDGIALGGILPAPMIIFSTFVGYLASGLAGSLAMTVGIFLPAFVFPIFFHRGLVALAENPRIRPFLLGVAAGVIGLIAAVTVEILDESVIDVPTAPGVPNQTLLATARDDEHERRCRRPLRDGRGSVGRLARTGRALAPRTTTSSGRHATRGEMPVAALISGRLDQRRARARSGR
jgi:chromate transporter